jgi:hypothetical protein
MAIISFDLVNLRLGESQKVEPVPNSKSGSKEKGVGTSTPSFYAASFFRLAFFRSCGSSSAFLIRIFFGVTSTISSSSM